MDIECEGWARILKVFPNMDFTQDLKDTPELAKYLKNAINTKSLDMEIPEEAKESPKLDNDFSKWIILNGLPKCDEAKSKKLAQLLIKLFAKKNFNVLEENIEMNFAEDGMTTGQAFVQMKNDEQAKIASALFNGHALDKKHTFSSCTFPDFDKIMAFDEPSDSANASTGYLELNAQVMETKNTPFAYQIGKNVMIDELHGQSKVLLNDEISHSFQPFNVDKPFTWSPKGTFLISIQSDKVEFIGGSKMTPLLTINEPKVESVLFSPCEKYILVYQPSNELAYTIWNFMTHEKLREFEQQIGEDGNSYKWSFDGKYIAKMTKKAIKKEPVEGEEDQIEEEDEEEEQFKTYITVYELPTMKMLEDMDGNRTSIPVDGLRDFFFMPNKNLIAHTSFPADDNVMPRITFMEVPSRQISTMHTCKDSQDLKMYIHPQGSYVGVMNAYLTKKTLRYSVELFDCKGTGHGSIPHQQILVNREVNEFYSIVFEPQQGKLAVLTNSKKVLKFGEKQFSNDPNI